MDTWTKVKNKTTTWLTEYIPESEEKGIAAVCSFLDKTIVGTGVTVQAFRAIDDPHMVCFLCSYTTPETASYEEHVYCLNTHYWEPRIVEASQLQYIGFVQQGESK